MWGFLRNYQRGNILRDYFSLQLPDPWPGRHVMTTGTEAPGQDWLTFTSP
jgi:hypothetical protein